MGYHKTKIEIIDVQHCKMQSSQTDYLHFQEFQTTWKEFFKKNNFSEIHVDKKDEFLKPFVKQLPKNIKKISLKEK